MFHCFVFGQLLNTVIVLQVRGIIALHSVTDESQWSTPHIIHIQLLPAPELATADLVSTSLEVQDPEHVITATVSVTWESPPNHKELNIPEAWVGSRSLREFEESDPIHGTVVPFQVRVAKHIHVCCSSVFGVRLVDYQYMFAVYMSFTIHYFLLWWQTNSTNGLAEAEFVTDSPDVTIYTQVHCP